MDMLHFFTGSPTVRHISSYGGTRVIVFIIILCSLLICHLLSAINESLLHGRDAFLLLHTLFDFTDSVVLLDIKFNFAAGESADSITSNISDCIGGYRQVLLLDKHDEIWLLGSGTGCLEVITALALKVENKIKSLSVKFMVRQYGELMDGMIIKVNGGRLPGELSRL